MDWIIAIIRAWEAANRYYISFISTFGYAGLFALVLLLVLSFLIFIRAGLPRYRYDYLSKLGWVRFLVGLTYTLLISYFLIMLWF